MLKIQVNYCKLKKKNIYPLCLSVHVIKYNEVEWLKENIPRRM